ncbi:replicative DNA helicase [Isosphaeraceae bacterium EP7]
MADNSTSKNRRGGKPWQPTLTLTPPPAGDRLPPQNIAIEQEVIGALLLDNDQLHNVMPLLKADDFYRDSHQIIFRSISDLYTLGKPVDALILADELAREGHLESIGGLDAINQLISATPHAANARYHAEIVRQKSISRRLIECANEIHSAGYSETHTADELLELAESRIFKIAEEGVTGETVELKDVVHQAMERISARAEGGLPISGMGSGFPDLDNLTGGFQGSQLVILAARPSMGKTAIALNLCEHVILEQKLGVLFVSLEMGQLELAERLLCSRSRVDNHKLRTGQNFRGQDMAMLGKAYDELRTAPLFIDDTPARNMLQITANARRLKLRHNLGLVVIDYIQLVDAEESRDSRQEQIAKISRRLKQLARELNIPVIALSQLNRGVENREDRRPRMADLRESGAIEQDADLVLLLHRPDYYDPNDKPNQAELIVAKNRSGATGSVDLQFAKNITRFQPLDTMHDDTGVF